MDPLVLQQFCKRLREGPAFLILGQNHLKLESGRDPFLSEILRKYGNGREADSATYDSILGLGLADSYEPVLAWMDGRCRETLSSRVVSDSCSLPLEWCLHDSYRLNLGKLLSQRVAGHLPLV